MPETEPEDLTQEFFRYILHTPWLQRADETRGKFRSFLLASLENFLRDRIGADRAKKRRAGYQHIPLDMADTAGRGELLASSLSTQSEVYETEWAVTIVALAWKRLEAEYADDGKSDLYAELKGFMVSAGDHTLYQTAADKLSVSSESIKIGVHRLRKRYGAILREEVARTVSYGEDVPGEMRFIREAFALNISVAA